MVVTFSDNPHLWIGLILEHRLKTTSIISFHLWQRINVFYLLCLWHRLLILTSAWFVQNWHSPALECAGSFVEVRFIDFFLCTDWISQHPFRPLVFKTIEEFSDPAFHIASQLSEFEAIKRVSSIVGRAITTIPGHSLTRSANTRGLLSANPAFLQTCSNILWFLKCYFWFENLRSYQLISVCNVYEAGRTSSSASNFYSATAFLPHSNSLSSQSSSYRFF